MYITVIINMHIHVCVAVYAKAGTHKTAVMCAWNCGRATGLHICARERRVTRVRLHRCSALPMQRVRDTLGKPIRIFVYLGQRNNPVLPSPPG